MHDMIELSKMSEQQLMDMVQTIERKLGGCFNQQAFDLMCDQKELIMFVLQERQQMQALKNPPLPSMNLTTDHLSEQEKTDEEKNKQPKN